MKTALMTALLSFFLVGSSALAVGPMCSKIFMMGPKYFSMKGLQFFRSQTLKKSMAYDFKPSRKGPTWLIIHGLGDDMTKVEKLTELADKDGYGVLRVDLFGHGETLKEYMQTHNGDLPGDLYYKDNVVIIRELLQKLQIKEVVIVGHSYGGGISYALASDLATESGPRKINVRSVHMMAPYVQRIDKFLKNYFQSPDFLLHQTAKTMQQMGTNPELVKTIMDPLFGMTWAMTAGFRYMNNMITNSLKVDAWQDYSLDPVTEKYIAKSYRQYFIAMSKKDENTMSADESRAIDIQVEAAIRVTKGIRDFDLLDTTTSLKSIGAPIQILGGLKDELVIPGQLYEFDQRLKIDNIPHSLDFLNGDNAHHLFPRYMPEETYQHIRAFQDAHVQK